MSTTKHTLSVCEAAGFLGVSEAQIYRLTRAGGMPAALRLGGRILISRDALERFLAGSPNEQRGAPAKDRSVA